MKHDGKKFLFVSFGLTVGLGLVFLSLILQPVKAVDVNVNATVPVAGAVCGNGAT